MFKSFFKGLKPITIICPFSDCSVELLESLQIPGAVIVVRQGMIGVVSNPWSGISDILALHNGVLYALEVKAPGKSNNATPHQRRFIAAVQAAGGQGAVVDTLDAVKELFHASCSTRKESDSLKT